MRDDENDDRAACRRVGHGIRAAVADGATESAFSGRWAEDLTNAWMDARPRLRSPSSIVTVARRSFATVEETRDDLPWYGQRKLDEGSHAAVAWLRAVRTARGYRWVCHIAGDCELLVIANHLSRVEVAVPFTTPEEFGYTPELLSSTPRTPPQLKWYSGRAEPGTELWLMTDALAQACVAGAPEGSSFWRRWAVASETEVVVRVSGRGRASFGRASERRRSPREDLRLTLPLLDEYQAAVQNPSVVFNDQRLVRAVPHTSRWGMPDVASGNFAVVFRLETGSRSWAVRCFTQLPDQASARYRATSAYLESTSHPWFVRVEYLDPGIKVKGQRLADQRHAVGDWGGAQRLGRKTTT